MLFSRPTTTDLFNHIINTDASKAMNDLELIETEIRKWLCSHERNEQLKGEMYYYGFHDILGMKRLAIGDKGELEEVKNLPNRHDIDNQYAIAVDKKTNYFLGKPIAIDTDNEAYAEALRKVMDRKFMKKMKNICKKALNGGIAWAYPHFDKAGKFIISVFPAHEIKPMWKDAEHDELDFVIRYYPVYEYHGRVETLVHKVEVYKQDGIYRYVYDNSHLVPDVAQGEYEPYFMVDSTAFAWNKIPMIAFKYNENEVPLIRRTKCLQDAINEMMSMFHNNMLEDNRNTILVIKNYDGTNLGEFRKNLATYGAVKVRNVDGTEGGVETLHIEVNADNYNAILEMLKMALIENARSFDGKLLKSGTPNQMNILSVYNEIDIDTNEMETEFQSSFEELLVFINAYLSLSGVGTFDREIVDVTFNRDMLINEMGIMDMLTKAGMKLSQRTLLKQCPYVDDVDEELEEIKREAEESMDVYGNSFVRAQEQAFDGEDEEITDEE